MKRRHFITIATSALICAPTLLFAGVADAIVRQLQAQGYNPIEVSRTWLGRIQIEAGRAGEQREIILNRKTGEILRDFSKILVDGDGEDDNERELLGQQEEHNGSGSNGGGDDDGGNDDGGGDGGDDDSGSDDDSGDDDGGGDDDSGGDDGGGDDSEDD
jgi:hypothetical protein